MGRKSFLRVVLAIVMLTPALAGCIKPSDALKAIGAIPPNSGSGARIVYRKGTQQVWVVNAQNQTIQTYRVSGNLSIPAPGRYRVYQKQREGIDNTGTLILPYFIVFNGNVGFHGYPLNKFTRQPIQSDAQLGQPLSHGCVRLANDKIQFLWNWAVVGTPVVVV